MTLTDQAAVEAANTYTDPEGRQWVLDRTDGAIVQVITPGGVYACDGCLTPFVYEDGCERLMDLRNLREGPAMKPTPSSNRSLRAHIRACWWCRVEADTGGDHHPYCYEQRTPAIYQ